jgi:hypothetical protein
MADRGPDGRFLKGHATSSPGRPVGVVNKITRSLREKILDGFGKEDGVTSFVRDLKRDSPGAAAALLARLLPPADEKPEGAGGTVIVNILPIASGNFFVGDPPQLVDETAARQIAGTDDAVPMLEHQVEEAIAAPVEVEPELEPEPQSGSDIVIVQSASLARRRQR